ncbi:MAG: dihydrolipoamide acetyltransferase family protein, partial [Planctomycetota bacterium]
SAGQAAGRAATASASGSTATATAAPPVSPPSGRSRPGRVKPASPAVRKLARSLGVDLQAVDGSGPGGRVTRADVERWARGDGAAAATAAPPAPSPGAAPSAAAPPPPARAVADLATTPGEPGRDHWGEVSHEPITRVRATIAENMTRSWTTIPHVTDSFDADVTELDRLRRQYNERHPDEPKLTMLPFVIRAVATVLRRHPLLNASWDGERDRIVHHRYVSIAVGVHSPRGLVAPVLRDTDRMGVATITAQLQEIIAKARSATFAVDDLKGGTFTISNPGAMGGSRYSTPIINPPQAAVLAIGRSGWQPAAVDGQVVPRYLMPLSLSFDHRLIDGGTEIEFQRDLVAALEQPVHLML